MPLDSGNDMRPRNEVPITARAKINEPWTHIQLWPTSAAFPVPEIPGEQRDLPGPVSANGPGGTYLELRPVVV
ncbi:hypothetical protein HJFPF1_09071 [Paramyrothecium foliicola]|nr:hypothetical protein HJFPF1_09071 [Paramyrothecium foliicola]